MTVLANSWDAPFSIGGTLAGAFFKAADSLRVKKNSIEIQPMAAVAFTTTRSTLEAAPSSLTSTS